MSSRPALQKARTPDAVRHFDDLVDGIMLRDDCSRLEAMRRARTEEPVMLKTFQGRNGVLAPI